jgi:hypothetical protein
VLEAHDENEKLEFGITDIAITDPALYQIHFLRFCPPEPYS